MKSELYDVDPGGNQMPQGMFWRNGVYYVRAMRRGLVLKRSTGKRDFKSALRRYHEIMKAWNDGDSGWDDKRSPVFEVYWKDYRAAYTVRKTPVPGSHGTKFRDDQLVHTGLKDFGRKPLDDFNKTFCQKWANRRRAMHYTRKVGGKRYPISEGTVHRELALFQAIFQQAIEDGLLAKNPWKGVERAGYKVRQQVLTEEDQAKLLAALEPGVLLRRDGKSQEYSGHREGQRFIVFLLGTGLRVQEFLNLREADDLSFVPKNPWVRVTRKSRGPEKKIQRVPLVDNFLLDILQEQLTEQGQLWRGTQGGYRKMLAVGCRRAGIAPITPHTLRHTFATRYLKAGGDIYVLSKILGHSSVQITERVYAHLLSEDLLLRSQGLNLGLRPAEPGKVLPFKKESTSSETLRKRW